MAITKVSRNLLNTGVSDSSDATAITIASDEKVGIGETSPLGKLHVKTADSGASADSGADELVLENSGDAGITILSGTSNSGSIRFGDSDDNDNGIIIYNHDSSPYLRFFTGGSVRARLDSHGLKFGSDTAAANALDDYEEGTWTPTVNSGTITLASNSSEYTKIGDMVFAQTRITGFSDGGSSAHFVLGGLPYSVGLVDSNIGFAWGNFVSANSKVGMYFFQQGGAYFGGTGYDPVRHSIFGSTTNVIISLIYRHG